MDAEEHRANCQVKDCDLCTDDDEAIRVSVSPRRFTLPHPSERRTKMEIKNQNSYPIYFRAETSNMDAFKTQPDMGRIPPNSKISVVVQFFNSATPIRMHEEVVVFTSIKPFYQYSKGTICPYCYKSVRLSKYHHSKSNVNPLEYIEDSEEHDFNGDKFRSHIIQTETTQHGNVHLENKKHPPVIEKEMKSERTYQTRLKHPEMVFKDSAERPDKRNGDHQVRKRVVPPERVTKLSGEQNENVNHCMRKLNRINCKYELEEICLHAFIHRPTNGSCGCNNCAELSVSQGGGLRIQEIKNGKFEKVRRLSDTALSAVKHTGSGGLYTVKENELKTTKGVHASRGKKGEKEAHILARIKKAPDTKEASDFETSETSSKDINKDIILKRKIISEEDFKKVQRKKMRKLQNQLEEESKNTTTTEEVSSKVEIRFQKKKDDKTAPRKKAKETKSLLKSIDKKCSRLLNITWTAFFILFILLITVVSFISYNEYFNSICTSWRTAPRYRIPCFYQLISGK